MKETLGQIGALQSFLIPIEKELDGAYDLIYQIFGNDDEANEVLRVSLRTAAKRSKRENFQRYAKLWFYRICIENINKSYARFCHEKIQGQHIPLEFLTLEEKSVLFLHDRVKLNYEEIAGVLQIPVSRVGRSLTYAREKVAKIGFGLEVPQVQSLLERVFLNRHYDSEELQPKVDGNVYYLELISKVQLHVRGLTKKAASPAFMANSLKQFSLNTEVGSWRKLAWHYKLGIEAGGLALVGLAVAVFLPWVMATVNMKALMAGRVQDVFVVDKRSSSPQVVEEISTDRLIASSLDAAKQEKNAEMDEFADVDFPSGDSYETGSAPIAPSKSQTAVYRLIVQSTSPRDLITPVRNVFESRNVKERELSGRVMPGGVYFDGVTSVSSYSHILGEIEKLGKTKTYSNSGNKHRPEERARVIVWVQQI